MNLEEDGRYPQNRYFSEFNFFPRNNDVEQRCRVVTAKGFLQMEQLFRSEAMKITGPLQILAQSFHKGPKESYGDFLHH